MASGEEKDENERNDKESQPSSSDNNAQRIEAQAKLERIAQKYVGSGFMGIGGVMGGSSLLGRALPRKTIKDLLDEDD